MKPRRSVLYMPGINTRALDKARALDCDVIIFDLEDAVAPDAKEEARNCVVSAIEQGGYGHRELIVRVNGLDTSWGSGDLAAVASLPIDGVLLPKVERRQQIDAVREGLHAGGAAELPIWIMIETPLGILNLTEFSDHPSVAALVMGRAIW